jgi:adenylate kinase family enzyme
VLNGLPRHVGQAAALDAILRVDAAIFLDCPAETVAARVRGNVGGDRSGREDDDPHSLARRLAVFADRTAPLIDHYRALGATIKTIRVTAEMTADAMWGLLE